ncbi:hypothetical protein ACFXKG_06510 [Streptomyces sp. NPDC059255]|uniref:hypothetical protein n=1 Tax=Streptomyces sp. NPDC059255 TaxID=3346793 RepID=UPI0036B677CD
MNFSFTSIELDRPDPFGPTVVDPESGTCYDMAPGEFSTASNDTDAVAHTFPAAGCRARASAKRPGRVCGPGKGVRGRWRRSIGGDDVVAGRSLAGQVVCGDG